MNKYRVRGTMKATGKIEFIILARSLDDAMDICGEDPRDFINYSTLGSDQCSVEFAPDEVIEVGNSIGHRAWS